jgi:hypothetical protein
MVTKKNGNKKMVKAINKAITGTAKELKVLQAKSKTAVKIAEKKWKAGEPQRQVMKANANKFLKKVGKESNTLLRKSVQLEKDIARGVKLGIKNSKKIK